MIEWILDKLGLQVYSCWDITEASDGFVKPKLKIKRKNNG